MVPRLMLDINMQMYACDSAVRLCMNMLAKFLFVSSPLLSEQKDGLLIPFWWLWSVVGHLCLYFPPCLYI